MNRSSFWRTVLGASVFAAVGVAGASTAMAAADLDVQIQGESGLFVYDVGQYDFTVKNVGNKTANSVSLTIDLPQTHTSPNVYVLGGVDALSPNCTQNNTTITCSLGQLRKGKSASVFVDLMLPQNSVPMNITADASTTSAESNLSNNNATFTPSLAAYPQPISTPAAGTTFACSGQNLTSFYECILAGPGAIMAWNLTLNGGGGVTLPPEAPPTATATWSQPFPEMLLLDFFDGGMPAGHFEGYGVGTGCFEGLTTFPNSNWVAPRAVCL